MNERETERGRDGRFVCPFRLLCSSVRFGDGESSQTPDSSSDPKQIEQDTIIRLRIKLLTDSLYPDDCTVLQTNAMFHRCIKFQENFRLSTKIQSR